MKVSPALYTESPETVGKSLRTLLEDAGYIKILDLNNADLPVLLLSQDPVITALKARGPCARRQMPRVGVLVDEMTQRVLMTDGRRHSRASKKSTYVGKRASFGTTRERIQLALQSAALLQRLDPAVVTLDGLEPWHVAGLYVWAAVRGLSHKSFNRMGTFWRDALITLDKDPKKFLPPRNETILARLGVQNRYIPGAVYRGLTLRGESGLDMVEQFHRVDPRMGITVELLRVLSLRHREGVSFQPKKDFDPLTGRVHICHGTKGGRRRNGDDALDQAAVRRAVEAALPFANSTTGSLIPDGLSRAQWMRKMRRVAAKLGYTRRDRGVTLYSPRHQGLQDIYRDETGVPAPVAGGTCAPPEDDLRGRRRAARAAGHNGHRPADSYLGCSEHSHAHEPNVGVRPSAYERHQLRHPFIRRRKGRLR